MKRLLVLATGGTIAGAGADAMQLNHYEAGALGVDALVNAVPDVQSLAQLDLEQIANVDSADLQFAHWCRLVERIREAFADDPELAGVVITHGTNTLEETAWLLQLLIDDPRPVVLVGAMRPATALSADGPLNLFQAIQVAVSSVARCQGVLVVMDGQIHAAKAVTKISTQGVSAFASPGSGPLGWVDDHGVHLPAVHPAAVPESRPNHSLSSNCPSIGQGWPSSMGVWTLQLMGSRLCWGLGCRVWSSPGPEPGSSPRRSVLP